ncbi:phenylalanine--tRNA ligase subunit beta [Christensenellaceae bacterium NSJ-63]|uniref:Phenylalanine--tRNA ligase beta subunit n=1 Tax=Guopingia tenuis TaxID=2763656 RepID=A0A926DHV4_9FIRM|nr:phenylalanine--tRNA ligase subunit beta [Guopingia tenuis]MBC8539185.1 phenylalanine--tRNA ligase subunit beta [Guopingia tenuis]
MLVPYRWLKDYIETDLPVKELAEKMVATGNGVEAITELGADIKNVVVGKIVKLEKHPDADKLQICQIDVGTETLQIVTGADNVFEGALVPVALCGSELPNGMKIKKGKLRGVESYGMLCSGEELCLKESDYPGAEVYGILILSGDWAPGTDIRKVIMKDDTVIEFEIGANRPDCLSVLGIAREAAAALDIPIKIPDAAYSEDKNDDIHNYVDVEVTDTDLCPRYMAKAVKNVKIGPSPDWMQARLRAAGIRPISNIVDITNFVMLETGQPMHAYDDKDIRGRKIIVRRAEDGETMKTLDGKEREFTSSMLLIADAEGPTGIAGVMGGENSEIKEDTKTVIYEAAKFMYGNIRQTSRGLGLATEASMRFSKGVDTANVEYAINRCCQLTEMLGAGEIVGGTIDILSEDLSEKEIVVKAQDINGILGTNLSAMEMKRCLDRVFLKTELDATELRVHIPHIRGDIDGKADIAEEVARIYGYDNIPENEVQGRIMAVKRDMEVFTDLVRHYITGNGFFECITYSFTGKADWDKLLLPEDSFLRRAVKIRNPLGDDTAYMRTTLIADALKVMATNLKHKNKNVKIFEIDKVYLPKELPLTELPEERKKMVLAMSGDDADFYRLKEIVENIFEICRVEGGIDVVAGGEPYFHPGRKALMMLGDKLVGQLGEIHPDVQENFGIPEKVYVAQMDMESLFEASGTKIRFAPLPKYPAIERDIAITVDKDAEAGTIRKAILKNGGKYIENVELFDVYEGEQLGKGKKSLAYALTFRSATGTLTDENIAKDMKRILANLETDFGAALRS